MEFSHTPVLLHECIELLAIQPEGIYVDGTAGGAGHSLEIAKRLTAGRLIAIDRDPDAVEIAKQRLQGLRAEVVRANYSEIDTVLKDKNIAGVDGILLDLGVSSYQLDTAERGFSYHTDAPLDMRMSKEGISAADIINGYPFGQLAEIIRVYGEEKYAGRIAAQIVKMREQKNIYTTLELAEIIKSAVPAKARREKNPCKKTFQAIRIAVNNELEHLENAVNRAFDLLNPHGRLCIITFHSLEDRLVKQSFAALCRGCTCPPDFPQCVCGKTPRGKLVTRKPVIPTEEETGQNKRSRSAKLRVIEKLA